MSLNTFCAQGRLASDVKKYNVEDDKKAVASFSLAVNRNYKTKSPDGEEYRPTDFLFCKAFGKTAQFISKYFEKGQVVVISNAEIRKDDNYTDSETGETVYGQMYVHLNIGSVMFNEQNKEDNVRTHDTFKQKSFDLQANPLVAAMQKNKKAVI